MDCVGSVDVDVLTAAVDGFVAVAVVVVERVVRFRFLLSASALGGGFIVYFVVMRVVDG